MDHIIPRWEWRTFGEGFGESDRLLASLAPEGVQEGDALYLLSSAADQNVKIRDGLMDIKMLQQVNADRLEQWKPVMKAAFPLSAGEVAKVFDALGLSAPPLARAAYTLDRLIDELVKPSGHVRAVTVHKQRTHSHTGGCPAEVTEVVADGKRTRTVAIESENPALVISAVRELGLDRFENVSYPRGLKRLIAMND
jgi:exopolyphosphatase/guanosine-5'-triphosphate,3'-diphosphate pyrophosphatase